MINRLSHSTLGNISFIALVTISYFVPRSLRSLVTNYDIVPRAIKLISPRLSYDNLYICNALDEVIHVIRKNRSISNGSRGGSVALCVANNINVRSRMGTSVPVFSVFGYWSAPMVTS